MGLASSTAVPLRQWATRTLLATLLAFTALVSVGITAPENAPFSIVIRPAFLRLGIDIDIKIGSAHLHAGWSALS